jgi:hypothetical protein
MRLDLRELSLLERLRKNLDELVDLARPRGRLADDDAGRARLSAEAKRLRKALGDFVAANELPLVTEGRR